MLKAFPFLTLPIFALIVIGLAVAIFPVFFAFRALVKPPINFVVGLWCVGLMAFLVFTLVLAWLYQLLASAVPQLNPYAGSDYESLDTGIFSLSLGLLLALPLTIWLQWLISRLKT